MLMTQDMSVQPAPAVVSIGSETPMPTAVVTGSSSGIGRATAYELAGRGYELILHARQNIRGLQETAAQIAVNHPSTLVNCITADISNASACYDLVQAAFHRGHDLQAWINVAGADILTSDAARSSFEAKLQHLWQTDVQGTICVSRLVGAEWLRQLEGTQPPAANLPCIINLGWDQAETGMEGDPGQLFGTTKAAVHAFSRSLAQTLAPHIRVNCVAPGWIKTAWGSTAASEYWDQRARSESLLGRWGTPEDVAQTIGWLASPAAQFINGQCISVAGGRAH